MNIVLVGKESLKLNAILSEFAHIGGAQLSTFNPAFLTVKAARLDRISLELLPSGRQRQVKVFAGIECP